MAIVAITSVSERNARRYVDAMQEAGGQTRVLLPELHGSQTTEELMRGVGGLLLPGGPDIHPGRYGQNADPEAGLTLDPDLDALELRVLEHALAQDMPVLAIGRGMQLLNVAFGGRLIQDLQGHRSEDTGPKSEPATHQIYVAPGAKAAAIIGSAGFFRVNSYHHQGLMEAQRAPRLMSTAYSVEDGVVEGLESPEHSWVIGLQFQPQKKDEVPRLFVNLFAGLHDRAERFEEAPAT
jgi:putative glutamine amidotransferase